MPGTMNTPAEEATIQFFLPGPTYVLPEVMERMLTPMIGHRSLEFKAMYSSLEPRLQKVFRTDGDVLHATGSATLVMESVALSLAGGAVLSLTSGAFSERWHAASLATGRSADKVSAPWGRAIDPAAVRSALERKPYDVVTVVHNETSTGVMNPVEEIAKVVRESSDAVICVDTVSSMGGAPIETDAWDLDVVLAGVQKAMAVPPGQTLFTLSDRAARRAESVAPRGFYTDLLRYRDKHRAGGTITTPALSVLFALDRQLDIMLEEGIEARWRRHRALRRQTEAWAERTGHTYASAADAGSLTVSCLKPPEGVSAPDLVAALAARGIVVGSGYGKWKPETFRIGHMGEVRSTDLEFLFEAIEDVERSLVS